MNREQLYKEIGLIDDELIRAADSNQGRKRRTFSSKKWVACLVAVMGLSSISTGLLAKEYYLNRDAEGYIRYLTSEDMTLTPIEYDVDKFLRALKSDNPEYVYIAINRLVECFNDADLREKALKAITPLMESSTEKIADAATFAVDILSKTYESPYLYKLADGSIVFTLFNQYSDYGSHNVLWRIKDDVLTECMHYSNPYMYIKEIVPSVNGKLIAVVTCSNKSEFIQVMDLEQGRISPELVESARVKYGAQEQLDTWIRIDHENYSFIQDAMWKDDNVLEFKAMLTYDNQLEKNVTVTYDFSQKQMKVES